MRNLGGRPSVRPLVVVSYLCVFAHFLPATSTILTHGFAVVSQGGIVYTVGETSHALAGQKSQGGPDAFIQAYDQHGNLLWTQQFGSNMTDRAMGVAADSTGVYLCGLTYGALPGHQSAGSDDSFVAKYDSTGNMKWLRQLGTEANDQCTAMAVDSSGGVYAVGATGGSMAGPNLGNDDAYIRKFDQKGNIIWTVQFGSAGEDRGYGVAVDSTGVYMTGRTDGTLPGQTNLGGLDAYVTKFDVNGNQLWIRQFGSPEDDRGWGIGTDSTGIYVVGRADGALPGQTFLGVYDAYIMKFDSDGNTIWTNQFGTSHGDRANGVVSVNGQIYIAGFTSGVFPGQISSGGQDAFLAITNPSGTTPWEVQFGSAGSDTARGIAADSTGLYLAGEAGATMPGQTVATGAFLVKYDFTGNLIWTRQFSAAN